MKELLEKYPKAAKVVREYYLDQLIESLKDKSLPDEFKEHVKQQGITNETISGIISGNPRLLFDVFDDNILYIGIILNNSANEMRFEYGISNGMEGIFDNGKSIKYNTRKEAEQKAVEEAFQLLEEKL
jgi:hypothetical protein